MKYLDYVIANISFPDWFYRVAIKYQLYCRLNKENKKYKDYTIQAYASQLSKKNITVLSDKANEQHYEVPVSFFNYVMGKHKKYSSCYFAHGTENLDDAEYAMLKLTCDRAKIKDGHSILDLGCGWGSLSIFIAQNYPKSTILAISNSSSQHEYIESQVKYLNLKNLKIMTKDVGKLILNQKFDRIVSVEMLEHVRNYHDMFSKISKWLKEDGYFFAHIFGHYKLAYLFDDEETSSWMARYFFSGGQMPSYDLFSFFNNDIQIKERWKVSGLHYSKTCRYWLNNMDKNIKEIKLIFDEVYGNKSDQFWIYWRLFFIACEELFSFNKGKEWQVYHYLFHKSSF